MSGIKQAIEDRLRRACEGSDFEAAANLLLKHYGPELLSFLTARLGNRTDAEEVFGSFAEAMWQGLPEFQLRSSARTWAYTLARNAAVDYASAPQRRAARNLPLSQHTHVSALLDRSRSATLAHLRTEMKDHVRALRERLDPDDRMLLMLRVDRRMAWRDLAQVMLGALAGEPESDEIAREAARLRKRFERVKADLREMATAEGLLADRAQRDDV